MHEILSKLLTVKSLVTLALTVVFCALSVTGAITGEQFLTIFTVVISFYFGTQYERKKPATEPVQEAILVEEVKEVGQSESA
jgi:hypothetical protein